MDRIVLSRKYRLPKTYQEDDMNRVFLCSTLFALVILSQSAVAQNNLDGAWGATLVFNGQPCVFNLVNTAGQHYRETLRCGTMMTSQSGTYVFANGVLVRTVVDWAPKQRYVMDNGYSGHYESNAKPPGGSFRVSFTSPNMMVWKDANFGGTITYKRTR
jgi:hypothetical protein